MGRMPVALIIAFAASLGLHAVALFGPEFDLAPEPEAPPLVAELRPLPPEPLPPTVVQAPRETERKPDKAPPVRRQVVRKAQTAAEPAVMTVPEPAPVSPAPVAENIPEPAPLPRIEPSTPQSAVPDSPVPAVAKERLPPRGSIRFRVDRGDANFEVGIARHDWELEDGRYRLSSVIETTGLAWLFHSVNIEMESAGRISDSGLQPEVFGAMREGRRARERALFDWETMKIRVGDRREYPLDPGAQDFLSFIYQIGFMDMSVGEPKTMYLATGKKYAPYRLESLGDEALEIPLGALRTRHIRSPGESTIDLWLAYEYRLLPVKIRHVDKKGAVTVLTATEIQLGQ